MEVGRFDLSVQQRWQLARAVVAESKCAATCAASSFDAEAFRTRLTDAIARHEILRTRFEASPGMLVPSQVVEDAVELTWIDEAGARTGDSALVCQITRHGDSVDVTLSAPSTVADSVSLAALLAECLDGAPTDDEPLQYADFAGWQAEKAAEAGAENLAAAAHWRSQSFDDVVAATVLDGDAGVVATRTLNATTMTAVAALQARLTADPRSLWSALFAATAIRVLGVDALSTTIAIDGRQDDELGGAIGAYTVALPAHFSDYESLPLSSWLARVDQAVAAATTHALLLPETVRVPHLSLQYHEHPNARDGIAAGLIDAAVNAADGTVRVEVRTRGAFAGHTCEAFVDHLEGLIISWASAVDATIADVRVWTDETRDAALRQGVATAVSDARPLLDAIADHATNTPDAIAVVASDATLTYRDLWTRASALAAALGANGHDPGAPVGVLLDRTSDVVAAIVAAWMRGAPYVPLHVDHPAERIATQLDTCGATVVICDAPRTSLVPTRTVIDVATVAASGGEPGAVTTAGTDLAYIIFTSGSTGVPKGVGVTHANLATYAAAARDRLVGTDGPVSCAMVTSYTTDLGNTSLALALLSGGAVTIAPTEVAVDAAAFAQWNQAHPVDVLKITPSHLRAMLTAGEDVLPKRLLVVGGEALPWDLVRSVEALGGCAVSNHYGPTETTIGALTMPVERGATHPASATVPIGRPLAGYRAYVLDEAGEPVPWGIAGELCIGGDGVADGYVGRADFTAERFVADPLGGRMYRTGDSVRRHPDDAIEFIGRIDGQVKIRGYRVEPGEIEAALERHDAVSQAAVVPNPEPSGELRLVAYVTGPIAAAGGTDALRAHLGASLPSHMVPAIFITLDVMPLTPNGKLDRKALPDPASIRSADDDYVAPRDDVETALCEMWGELLGLDRVGVEDDFFGLGGHSLLAAQVIARVLRDFGVHLPLHTLFVAPTVEALAVMITEEQIAAAGGEEAYAAMLDELEGLSDEEVEAMLNAEAPDAS